MEFSILDNGFLAEQGCVKYQWFKLAEAATGQQLYRAVALRELTYLPIETRDDPDMLGKQWSAVRGLYNANADFIYTALGVFRPTRLGVVQFYGATAEDVIREVAIGEAMKRLNAVEATLANFPQSRTVFPELARVELLTDRLRRLPRVLALLGHPDPRLAKKGLGRDGAMGVADDEPMTQQGENLLRGLARINEDFVFLVTAAHVTRPILTSSMIRMAQIASQIASRQKGSIGVGFSIAIPLAAALSNAYSANLGHASSVGHSTSEGVSQGWSQGTSESWGHSTGQGASHGTSHTESSAVTDSTGVSQGTSGGVGWGHTDSVSSSVSGSHTDSASQGVSGSHTDSASNTVSGSHTDSHAVGVSHAEGSSWSQGNSASSGWSEGASHTQSAGTSASDSTGSSTSSGSSTGHTASSSLGTSQSQGMSDGASSGHTASSGESTSVGASASVGVPGVASAGASANHGWQSGAAESVGTSHAETASTGSSQSTGSSDSVGTSAGVSSSVGHAEGTSTGVADSTSQGTSGATGSSSGVGGSVTDSRSESWGSSDSSGWAQSTGSADSRGWSASTGTADSRGWASGTGAADSTSGSQGWSEARSSAHSVSSGVADSESWGESTSEGWSEGKSVAQGQSASRSQGSGLSAAEGVSLGAGRGFSGGMSAGLVPGVSISRNWATEDDVAIRLTEVARGLEGLLNTASHEGGFMTTALLLATDDGERAAEALAPQAFHGPNVPTPVLTVPAPAYLREHALAFRPSLAPDGDPFRIEHLWTRYGTLLTPAMVAAYTCPNLFEEGTAVTIQEKLPPLAFYPELRGEAILGHQVTGDLTLAPLRLSRDAHFHTAFCGDTGYGKSVAAVRMAYETTRHWQLKTIVLDFGAGWRQLLNAPGLAGHVEIRQLSPGGVRPLRWNPLQIGRNILPEVQWRAFSDIFGTIAQLGAKRQIHELREVLRRVYLAAGVLVDDPECRNDPAWGVVRPTEDNLVGQPTGTPLGALDRLARQRLAVARSQHVGLGQLYRHVEGELRGIPPKDIRRSILEGINFRLQPLVQGEANAQYAGGVDAIDINEVVPGDWGIAVLEGGAFLDEFSKAFLLGWAAWQLYTDAVVLRSRRTVTQPAHLQIFFEEANKMLAGLDAKGGGDEEGGASTADQFANMWRDSRKYGIWLHLVTQSPALIPPGIMSSCNNIFVAQLKNGKDRDAVIAALARSEKGFVDEPWRRFLASLPVARAVVKLGYSTDRARLEPCYIQPLLLNAREPSDAEVAAVLGEIAFR
jgi:hypothetical protein